MFLTKHFESPQEHVEPAESDLDLIRKLALRDVKPEEIWCGKQYLCNDRHDRTREKFPEAYLQQFEKTLPSKSLLAGHVRESLPIGRYYKAAVEKTDHGLDLAAHYYLLADSVYVPQIEVGVLRDVSVGYTAGPRDCDLCEKEWHPYREGKDYCEHWPGELYDSKECTLTYRASEAHKAEAQEGSFVWLGAQYGAQAVAKSFEAGEVAFLKDLYQRLQGAPQPGKGETQMPTLEEVQAQLLETKSAHERAAGDWQRREAELKAQAADGEWGQTYLKGEIARFAGLLEESETYAVILETLKDAPCAKLAPVYEELKRKVDAKLSGGAARTDTNPPPPGETRQSEPGGLFRRRRLVTR